MIAITSGLVAASYDNSLTSQIQQDVHQAITKTRTAKSLLELELSGASSPEVFKYVHALNNPEALKSLCNALSALTPEELAYFDPSLQDPRYTKELSCNGSLRAKLENYWKDSRIRLERYLTEHGLASSLTSSGQERNPASVKGALSSIEIPLRAQDNVVVSGRTKDGLLREKQIVLTFNDGPSPDRTEQLLAILKAAHVRAMFFQAGQKIRAHSDLTRKTFDAGHIIASHSMTHAILSQIGLNDAFGEIDKGREQLAATTGRDNPFVRMPYGASNEELNRYLHEKGLTSFYWNMDSRDWQTTDARELWDQILKELDREKGGILLMHESNAVTLVVLPYLLNELKARGYSTAVFVPKN
ncbi:MAG: polysaccharide deacetylase family protein [Oligoflexia bacterium]|nr:polysaccharide deacetylase family protein [Oligoflexia bacterium]